MGQINPGDDGVVARCTISGAVHDHAFEGELIQRADGQLLRRSRNGHGPPLAEVAFEPVTASLDLRRELDRLRDLPPLERSGRRVAQLEGRTSSCAVKLWYPRPLIGDEITDNPADQVFAALWGWPKKA